AHAAVVASPSAARALLAALGPGPLRAVELVAIGSTTAAALAAAGLAPRLPARPEFAAAAALFEPDLSRTPKEAAS
ncbi:MAG TPA: uroporphyrinogen-III synthase, partial [Candidatus Eisenbacteria bacterium]|nr:uroporphyrinogen-III synthase [Candidatus Eisenbacteria bacterium]